MAVTFSPTLHAHWAATCHGDDDVRIYDFSDLMWCALCGPPPCPRPRAHSIPDFWCSISERLLRVDGGTAGATVRLSWAPDGEPLLLMGKVETASGHQVCEQWH